MIIQRNNQAKTSRYHLGKLGLPFSVLTSMLGSSLLVPRSFLVDFESTSILPESAKKPKSITPVHTKDTKRKGTFVFDVAINRKKQLLEISREPGQIFCLLVFGS